MGSLVKGVQFLLKKNNVTVVEGFGSLVDKHTVKVKKADGTEEIFSTDYVILATGSVPMTLASGKNLSVEHVLAAIGRAPFTKGRV